MKKLSVARLREMIFGEPYGWGELDPETAKFGSRLKAQLEREGLWKSQDVFGSLRPIEALLYDLQEVRKAWKGYLSSRGRDGIYSYLQAVFDLVAGWREEGSARWSARWCLRMSQLPVAKRPDPFDAVILCTAKTDRRTRMKWARALNYARRKPKGDRLKEWARARGGINGCAAQGPACSTAVG